MCLTLPRFSAVVDPRDPARGLHRVQLDGRPCDSLALLAVELSPVKAPGSAAIDAYVRGGDLAITYADRPEPEMHTQIYWRAAPPSSAAVLASLELLVSVQTDLLDSCPTLRALSRLTAERALQIDDPSDATSLEIALDAPRVNKHVADSPPRGYLFRLANSRFSYAEMVHPADSHEERLTPSREACGLTVELSHELFAQRLEKGVILRSRVQGLVLDQAGDEELARRRFAAFLAAELPLTA
jgi:hypothetical protein